MEELYKYIENENIILKRADLEDSYGYCNEENKLIVLDKKINSEILEKCILAEECGHYFVGITPTITNNNDYFTKLQRSKNEFKAKKWVVDKLVPYDKFKPLIEQNAFKYELAEELSVTEDIIEKAYEICKLKGEFL